MDIHSFKIGCLSTIQITLVSRDVSTGATGATGVAPKFSDTLTLFQPRGADSAHHRRGRTYIFPALYRASNFLFTAVSDWVLISKCFFWCLLFPPKNERKQLNLRYHSSKVEFLRSFFGGNQRHQKPFRNYLTFNVF